MQLRRHTVTLRGERVTLRPLVEDDWPLLERWNADTEILAFTEFPGAEPYDEATVRSIYVGVSQAALCFVIEVDGRAIGEAWLQRMNLERLLEADRDIRRIDLMLGEKDQWGRGYGTETIALLTDFAFADQRVDAIYGVQIDADNPRSRRAFERCGFQVVAVHRTRDDVGRVRTRYDLRLDAPPKPPSSASR